MKSLLSVLVFFIICYSIFSQEDHETIATASSVQITVEEFRNRFEFMPHLNYSNDNYDALKKEFLYSLSWKDCCFPNNNTSL